MVGVAMRPAVFLAMLAGAWALLQDKRKLNPNSPAFLEAAGIPALPEETPVPTTMKCITNVVIQYMLIYLALALTREVNSRTPGACAKLEESLKAATHTLAYGPMLCALFIACRLRVEFLSKGRNEPQPWVQRCMEWATFGLVTSSLAVMILPFVVDNPVSVDKATGEVTIDRSSGNPYVLGALTTLQYILMICMYVGTAGVIIGINIFKPPDGIWPDNKIPPPAPAIACTMYLTVVFFGLYLAIAIARSVNHVKGSTSTRVESVIVNALRSMEFAPMLCVLFLAARLRAMSMGTEPQSWAQTCFYACTIGVIVQTLLAICVPLAFNGETVTNEETNVTESTVEPGNKIVATSLTVAQWACMISIYAGFTVVIASIFLIEHPDGPESTIPLSPMAQCVVNLTAQYFFIYLLLWILITVKSYTTQASPWLLKALAIMSQARVTVQFAPMLSILFIATRMRALQMTDNKGAPPAWVQDGMFMATWAVLLQFLMVIAVGLVAGDAQIDGVNFTVTLAKSDDGETAKVSFMGVFLTVARFLMMFLMYGGIALVVTGLFVMTPETANGRGSVPLVSDAVRGLRKA